MPKVYSVKPHTDRILTVNFQGNPATTVIVNYCPTNSGVARAFPGGRLARPEGLNEDKNLENLRIDKNNR